MELTFAERFDLAMVGLSETFSECYIDLQDVVVEWDFVNVVVAVSVIMLIGSGLLRTKFKGLAWGIAMAALWSALHAGVARDEWGEVLFNGTLL